MDHKCECKIMPLAMTIPRTVDNPNQYGIMYCSLHAAAPDLLEALNQFVHHVSWLKSDTDDYLITGKYIQIAREAIAKAVGGK